MSKKKELLKREINIGLAHGIGWWVDEDGYYCSGDRENPENVTAHVFVDDWNPYDSLDQCRIIENKLEGLELSDFYATYCHEHYTGWDVDDDWDLLMLSSNQKAEALYIALVSKNLIPESGIKHGKNGIIGLIKGLQK